jgi:hypothetical protein
MGKIGNNVGFQFGSINEHFTNFWKNVKVLCIRILQFCRRICLK